MTLDEFRAWALPRCKQVPHLGDDMPCLVWQGAVINKGRDPRASIGGRLVMVRRAAWAAAHPRAPLGIGTAKPGCDCLLCVEPSHLKRATASEFRSVPKNLAGRLNMQDAARAARSRVKAPEVVVPQVLADPRPAWQVARDLGLGEDVIRDMRAGKWNRAAFGSSPFAGLGAIA